MKKKLNITTCLLHLFFHRTKINAIIVTGNVLTYQVDMNVDVKRDITEMELNRANSPMNASKTFTTATKRGPIVSTHKRVSNAAVRKALKATGAHAKI